MKNALLIGSAALAACCLATTNASALELGTPAKEHPYRSPQNFAFELRFSPYNPAVDDEPGLSGTPFKDAFGTNPRFYIGAELDWQTFRIPFLGTIGPGFSVGRVAMSRPATTESGRASGDTYGLIIYPMSLNVVLRGDALWKDLGVPLVPYGKLGLGLGVWEATNSTGTASADGIKGDGNTFGTNLAIGLAFPLDVLDSGASRNMDNAVGINGTFLYAEYYNLNLNGLGASNALYVGTTSWAAGLTFEF